MSFQEEPLYTLVIDEEELKYIPPAVRFPVGSVVPLGSTIWSLWIPNEVAFETKSEGDILFITPPLSTSTKSASNIDVVVAGAFEFPVVNIVPLTSGSIICLSAVGSSGCRVVSKVLAVAPSNTIEPWFKIKSLPM